MSWSTAALIFIAAIFVTVLTQNTTSITRTSEAFAPDCGPYADCVSGPETCKVKGLPIPNRQECFSDGDYVYSDASKPMINRYDNKDFRFTLNLIIYFSVLTGSVYLLMQKRSSKKD